MLVCVLSVSRYADMQICISPIQRGEVEKNAATLTLALTRFAPRSRTIVRSYVSHVRARSRHQTSDISTLPCPALPCRECEYVPYVPYVGRRHKTLEPTVIYLPTCLPAYLPV